MPDVIEFHCVVGVLLMGGSQRRSWRKDKSEGEKWEKSLDVQSLLRQGFRIGLDHWGLFGKANISAPSPAETLQCDFPAYTNAHSYIHKMTYSQRFIQSSNTDCIHIITHVSTL